MANSSHRIPSGRVNTVPSDSPKLIVGQPMTPGRTSATTRAHRPDSPKPRVGVMMDWVQDTVEQAATRAKARFEAIAREAKDRAESDHELAASLQAMTATVKSRQNEVRVTVNHAGQVTDVVISKRGMELSAQELSRMAQKTIRRPGAEVGQLVGKAVRESWGDDTPESTQTLSAYEAFGAAPQDTSNSSSRSSVNNRMPWNIGCS